MDAKVYPGSFTYGTMADDMSTVCFHRAFDMIPADRGQNGTTDTSFNHAHVIMICRFDRSSQYYQYHKDSHQVRHLFALPYFLFLH
jgi:hypothetical protein